MKMLRTRAYVAAVLTAIGCGCVALPSARDESAVERVALDQGWRPADRALFAHQSQGSVVLPYEWFVALEQPEVKFIGAVGLFRDPAYLSRFGFLPAVTTVEGSESALRPVHCEPKVAPDITPSDPDYTCGLPVGLSRATVRMPDSGESQDVVGFTCAACHTSDIHLGGTAIRVEGASNPLDVTQFQDALGGALLLTQRLPFRFNRFAERILRARGLDPDAPGADAERDRLRRAFDAFMSASVGETVTAQRKRLYVGHPGGFGRIDALARIGNMVFGTDMNNDANLAVGSAPVKFPSLWDAPYFSWAQYNGSIEQSMVRNVGEALGVRARISYARGGKAWGTSGEREETLTSTVDIAGLYALEKLLRGSGADYFNGLRSPVWPEAYFGAIAWDRADRGRQLYQTHCQGCHLPPTADLVSVVDLPFGEGKGLGPQGQPVYAVEGDPRSPVVGLAMPMPGAGATSPPRMVWIANNHPDMLGRLQTTPFKQTEFFLNLDPVDLGTIRTDPGQATNFAKAIIDTGTVLLPSFPQYNGPSPFPVRTAPIGVALQMVTISLTTQFYDRVDAQTAAERAQFIRTLPPNLLARDAAGRVQLDASGTPVPLPGIFMDGKINRDEWNGYRVPAAEANLGYRPHPLNGIWASPPYLHNGSVPNLYELLSPYDERSKAFYTGSRDYDLNRIGYKSDRFRGGFRYDTSVAGNSNYGHLFQEGARGNGIIGPLLTPDDRLAIIEFLKTLCPPGTRTDFSSTAQPRLCAPLPGLPAGR